MRLSSFLYIALALLPSIFAAPTIIQIDQSFTDQPSHNTSAQCSTLFSLSDFELSYDVSWNKHNWNVDVHVDLIPANMLQGNNYTLTFTYASSISFNTSSAFHQNIISQSAYSIQFLVPLNFTVIPSLPIYNDLITTISVTNGSKSFVFYLTGSDFGRCHERVALIQICTIDGVCALGKFLNDASDSQDSSNNGEVSDFLQGNQLLTMNTTVAGAAISSSVQSTAITTTRSMNQSELVTAAADQPFTNPPISTTSVFSISAITTTVSSANSTATASKTTASATSNDLFLPNEISAVTSDTPHNFAPNTWLVVMLCFISSLFLL